MMQILGWASRLSPFSVRLSTAAFAGIHFALAFLRRPAPAVGRVRGLPRWLLPAAGAAVVTLTVRLLLARLAPPEGWDSLGYHLPFVVRWIQQGNLDLTGWAGTHRYFAWNGELLSAWLGLLDGGALDAAKLPQILALPLLYSSASVLGRRLAGARWAAACALAVVSLPIVLIQSGLAYVDVLYAAFWIAAVAAAVAWARTGRPVHFAAFAAAAGLAWGTKSTIYYLAPLLIVPTAALWTSASCRKTAVRNGAGAAALLLAGGAGSYIRNLVLTGNPIFPFGLSLGGIKIFKGVVSAADMPAAYENWFVSSPWGWLLYPFKETLRGVWGYTHLNGFGPLFALGCLLFAAAIIAAWKKRDVILAAFLSLFPAVLILFFTLQPVRLPRYIVFLAPLPIIGLAAACGRIRGAGRTAIRTAWTLAIIAGCAGVWAYMAKQPGYRSLGRSARAGERLDAGAYYRAQYGALGRAWEALNRKIGAGDTVAVSYGELMLPWAGDPPRARVRAVVRGRSPFPGAIGGESEMEWLAAIDRIKARFFVVWSPAWAPEAGRRERESARARPDRFALLERFESADYGEIDIYRVWPNPGSL